MLGEIVTAKTFEGHMVTGCVTGIKKNTVNSLVGHEMLTISVKEEGKKTASYYAWQCNVVALYIYV